jgi:heme-degrading monooxygenase HmoA
MITVGMDYNVVPGKGDQFVAVFEKVLKIMSDMDGHGETHLYRDVFSDHSYLIVSRWTDKAAFDAFIASDRFRNVTDWGKENVLTARPNHEIYGEDAPAAGGKCPVSH